MSLRYAYNTNGCANHRLDDALSFIADAGYDGVALTLDIHHLDPFADGWAEEAECVGRRLRALRLGSVIETGARFLLDPRDKHEPTLVTAAAEGRARRVDFLKRAVDIAAILGSEAVSFWAGVPKPGVDREAARGWLRKGLEQVVAHAQARGVTPAFEPEPGMLVETAAEWEALGVEGLQLALDTGHCIVTQDIDPAEAVRLYADRLGTVALEDMRRGVHEHLPFGQGDMDVPSVLSALEEINFPKLVCVELSRESPRAHLAIPESIAWLKAHEGAA
ncbi:MAG: sugar phosphate isomerase/epimerase [Caulobacteraceae bacterium]|nr:sugar phosphate isomerase/epimerase [Caulobacter sp.]